MEVGATVQKRCHTEGRKSMRGNCGVRSFRREVNADGWLLVETFER
jgi:hypothetical protein